ncbi:MAG TPA: helix-turn-helix domain-containing protein [Hyphomicrobiaceae bacterium]|nr:helix-turn-helix domain-containing protein [Hyphomicrobiaceae bacterium]
MPNSTDATRPFGRRPTILLLAAPETSASILYGLFDVLTTVGSIFPELVKGAPERALLDVRIVSADGRSFSCVGDIPVRPHCSITDFAAPASVPDAIVVCDMYVATTAVPTGRYPRECAWLREMHAAGAFLTSVCSGSLVLADSGVLEGREATAHWAYGDMFRRYFPRVTFRESAVLCLKEQDAGIVTAGGANAWNDLAFYLIARFCGYSHAIQTAKVFLLSVHADSQCAYAVMTRPMDSKDAVVAECQAWIAENYEINSPVEQMARRSGLSARTFARRFQAATGYTPIDYVQALRIEEAKQELERDQRSVEDVAAMVGYEDDASFRRVFKQRVGLTPAAYRKKFQSLSARAAAYELKRPKA